MRHERRDQASEARVALMTFGPGTDVWVYNRIDAPPLPRPLLLSPG